MSNPIEAAFEEWIKQESVMKSSYRTHNEFSIAKLAFTAGVSHAAKANTELIKEYQETMEKINGNT